MRTILLFALLTVFLAPGVYRNYVNCKPANVVAVASLCLCGLCLVVSLVTAANAQARMEAEYQAAISLRNELQERACAEDMTEHDRLALNEEISLFNERVIEERRKSENPWLNAFVNVKIGHMGTIDFVESESPSAFELAPAAF